MRADPRYIVVEGAPYTNADAKVVCDTAEHHVFECKWMDNGGERDTKGEATDDSKPQGLLRDLFGHLALAGPISESPTSERSVSSNS